MASRAALAHDWLTGMRGGEKVLEGIAALHPGAPIFTLFHVPGSVSATLERHPIHPSFLQRVPGIRRHYRHLLPLFPTAIEDFDLADFELVISSSHCAAKGIRAAPGATHVCYCHTPMRYAWDQEHVYFPRRRGLVARLRGLLLTRLRIWDVASAARVDTFLTNSSFVAERIRRYYRREAQVVPPPVDVDRFTPATGAVARDYALAVAALVPYKRLEVAIEACRLLRLRLEIVGTGGQRRRLERLAGAEVSFRGTVPEATLLELYRGAACVVQPGVEDFGIGVVEALACGTPVVARGRGGVLDIVADGQHGVLYDVPDGVSPAAALADAVDKCRQMGFNSMDLRRRANDFSPQRFSAALREAIARHEGSSEGQPT